MTKSSPAKLKYQKARNAEPAEVKKRVMQNAARREAMAEGKVKKGDGKEVDHKRMLDQGGTNAKGNLRVVSESENKGWRKRSPGAYTRKK